MKDLLLGYQLVAGLSDASTGALLLAAPVFTIRMMGTEHGCDRQLINEIKSI